MPGTPTPYYGFPIPADNDPADAPHDFQQLAQKIEDTLKNGYRIPTGALSIGSPTTVGQSIIWDALYGADTYRGSVYLHNATGDLTHQLLKNSVEAARFRIHADSSLDVLSGGAGRPIPFATWAGRGNATVSASVTGSAVFTLPTGRFNATPASATYIANATTIGTATYYAYIVSADNTSLTVGVRQADNVSGTTNIGVFVSAVQMTPTSGPG